MNHYLDNYKKVLPSWVLPLPLLFSLLSLLFAGPLNHSLKSFNLWGRLDLWYFYSSNFSLIVSMSIIWQRFLLVESVSAYASSLVSRTPISCRELTGSAKTVCSLTSVIPMWGGMAKIRLRSCNRSGVHDFRGGSWKGLEMSSPALLAFFQLLVKQPRWAELGEAHETRRWP